MSGDAEGLVEEARMLALLQDEVFYATDRLSRSETRAVVHSIYNGDWLAAHDAAIRAETLANVPICSWHQNAYPDICWWCEVSRNKNALRRAAQPTEGTCPDCGHQHTPDGCTGAPTDSDRWAGVGPAACDCADPTEGES